MAATAEAMTAAMIPVKFFVPIPSACTINIMPIIETKNEIICKKLFAVIFLKSKSFICVTRSGTNVTCKNTQDNK